MRLRAETARTGRVCAYRVEFKRPSSQLRRTDLGLGLETGTLLPKSVLLDGESEEGHKVLHVSRRQQGLKK